MTGKPFQTWFWLLGVAFICPQRLHAQTTAAETRHNTVALRQGFAHLTMEQGLPSNDVLDILVDSKGYLWAATANGLCRYDGYSFVTYKFEPRDSLSLGQNLVFSLFEDLHQQLWVATAEGGISRFDRNTEKFIPYKPPQPPNNTRGALRAVSTMNADRQGFLWIGSYSGELRRFDPGTGQFSSFDYDLHYHPDPNDPQRVDRINCIYRDSHNNLWVGNRSGLHQLIIGEGQPLTAGTARFRHYLHDPRDSNSLAGTEVMGICEDHAGRLWISTDVGLQFLDPITGRFVHYRHHRGPNGLFPQACEGGILEDARHYLWISMTGGVDRLDPQRKQFDHFQSTPGDINGIDKAGNRHLAAGEGGEVWFSGFGIHRFDPYQLPFARYRHDPLDPHSINGYPAFSVCEDRRGTVWLATRAGLEALDKRTGSFRHYLHHPTDANSLADNTVSSVLEDDEGKLWVSTWGGAIDRLNPVTGVFTHYIGNRGKIRPAQRRHYSCMSQDSSGVLWIGETSGGITRLDYRAGKVQHYSYYPNIPEGVSDYQVNCICPDDSGGLWIGHGSVATSRLDRRTGRFTDYPYRFSDPRGISSNLVRAIIRDRQGVLWLGTAGGGFCCYHPDTRTFTTYTEKDGLRDNNVMSIVEDNAGILWLGTAKGLCRFSPRDKKFVAFDLLNSPRADPSVKLLGKDRDGVIYYLDGDESVNVIDPATPRYHPFVPPVLVTRLRIFNKPIPFDEDAVIDLPYDQSSLSFEFAALDFPDIQHDRYRYWLECCDNEWTDAGNRHTATYNQIDPGEYRFHIKAFNNLRGWTSEGKIIRIHILPPWYQSFSTFIAYIGVGTMVITLVILLFQRRAAAKERKDNRAREFEMQALRAQMNPHFIFNSLTSINKFILTNDTLAASDYLVQFSQLIRMVLHHSKQSHIPLDDELTMLRLYLQLEKLRFKESFDYAFDIGDDIDVANIIVPPLIFQPFVENAAWHGLMHKDGSGLLDIRLRKEGNMLICTITDNGVGRTQAAANNSRPAEKKRSMAIAITRQRLTLANGGKEEDNLDIEDLYHPDRRPAGTKVTIRIRVDEQ